MLWSIEDIESGSPITAKYTEDKSYFDDECRCASCHPDSPPQVITQAVSAIEEPSTRKRRPHRAGRRMRKIRRKEAEECNKEEEQLDSELVDLDEQLKALDRELGQ